MREKPLVIGLAGPAGVGKSTLAYCLRNIMGGIEIASVLPSNFIVLEMVAKLLGGHTHPDEVNQWMVDWRDQPCPHLGGRTVRDATRALCDLLRSRMSPDAFLAPWAINCDRFRAMGLSVVNSSVRFGDEVEMIRARGGVVVTLSRADGKPVRDDHASERQAIRGDLHLAITHTDVGAFEAARAILDLARRAAA